MTPRKKQPALSVNDISISLTSIDGEDYISLTDMCGAKDSNGSRGDIIRNWLRRRDTLDYLASWESLYNPNFNYVEFDVIRNSSGTNRFTISPKEWVSATNATGIITKAGRYGGTYAHKDIAFNFGMWISPQFQLYIIKEYQRLKSAEQNALNQEWNIRRELSKTNYRIHTDAVKNYIIPRHKKSPEWLKYAEEADIINQALFGCTAKEWQEANPQRHLAGENIRDSASINDLIVLSNLESQNATLIQAGLDKSSRLDLLTKIARQQLTTLNKNNEIRSLKKLNDYVYLDNKDKDEDK